MKMKRGESGSWSSRRAPTEPRSVLLNIRKADHRVQSGDDDLACYFYRRALQFAGDGALPQEEAAELRRAQAALAEAAGRAHSRRVARLTERGLPPQQWSPRLRESLELAAAPRPYHDHDPARTYAQDPTHHFYPGLPRIQFYDPARFDWVQALESATAAIREELVGLLAKSRDSLRPFVRNADGRPMGVGKALVDGQNWGVLALCEQGWADSAYVRQCPLTWDTLLRHAPVPRVPGWGPSAVFSLLKAGAHIGAHTGMYNTRLICHLPLIVPPGCRFRVGDEVREWEEGKLMIFDDTIEHEAWNDGPEDRVVLIFDIWRPELTDQEKLELTMLFSD
ncbi:MAG: aspartyl/asparaginyl beta-hydroxylase domain-containing protein [Allosphingosinicella sp.]|uniref:aspartyl/asparaginyl beta-hydroxylase domain-containing protein n=1 Tax=Allosphingosinicella sp. TaxID=2823234 RepID=UPI00393C4D84